MDEYINRKTTIEALREAIRAYPLSFYNGIEVAITAVFKRPAADVVPRDLYNLLLADNDDMKEHYTKLLNAARAMHTWIFLNTTDELEAYGECGLDDDMNTLLGYGGQFEIGGCNNG